MQIKGRNSHVLTALLHHGVSFGAKYETVQNGSLRSREASGIHRLHDFTVLVGMAEPLELTVQSEKGLFRGAWRAHAKYSRLCGIPYFVVRMCLWNTLLFSGIKSSVKVSTDF